MPQSPISLTYAPSAVVSWVRKRRQRNLADGPKGLDPKEFCDEWRKWWTKLQPSWRTNSRRGNEVWPLKRTPSIPQDEDWASLLHRGQEGLCLLLLSLGWWNAGLKTTADKRGWASAVDDVSWVLKHVNQFLAKAA